MGFANVQIQYPPDFTDSAYPELRVCEKDFFDCDTVQLAHRLLGKYLYFPLTDIGPIMIIDTEAYPFGDEVYTKILGHPETQAAIPDQPGVLFRLSAQLHYDVPDPGAAASSSAAAVPNPELYHLYVRAKSPDPEVDLKSVVLIRSCMPRYLDSSREHMAAVNARIEERLGYNKNTLEFVRHNLLINPLAVAKAVVRDFERPLFTRTFALYEKTGCRLLFDPCYYPLYLMLHGRRVLDKLGKFADPEPVLGVDFKFRFLYNVEEMHYNVVDFDQMTPVPVPLPRLGPPPPSSIIQMLSPVHPA